ncbi:MAG: alpha/beta hydrolase [Candidatus Alcyoniella australis]|nr:alpha/beta hydrolase [Candidatus Alcyoniella australis]
MRRHKEAFVESFDGTRIHYVSQGEGMAIVCCDGIGCDGYAWKYLAEHFRERCRIVRWHYRGHGQSETPTDQNLLSIEDCCRDLLTVMDDDGIDKAVLVGHSMGCQVILEMMRMAPERVLAMVPVCGSYGRPLDTFHDDTKLKKAFPYLYPLITLFPEPFEAIWKRIVPTELAWQIAVRGGEINGHMVRKKDFMPYLRYISTISLRVFIKMLDHASRHSTESILPTIKVPVLIVAAEHDSFTPMWLSERMNKLIPGSEMIVIPEGTHTGPIEMPDMINLRVEKFLVERLQWCPELPLQPSTVVTTDRLMA